jgi:hypothetical protein
VFATLGVDAGVFHHQPLHRLSADDVGVDNLIYVRQLHPAIPDRLRIDHQIWTVFALVEAARLVGPDFAFQSTLGQLLLEQFLESSVARRIATAAGMPLRPLVSANENVLLKLGHEKNVQDLCLCHGVEPEFQVPTDEQYLTLAPACPTIPTQFPRGKTAPRRSPWLAL